MNVFQARPKYLVELLLAARHVDTGQQIWMPGTVVRRNFLRGGCVHIILDDGVGTKVVVSAEKDFEMPNVRPVNNNNH